MQSSHRVDDNWALSYAIQTANNQNLPIIVYFGLTPVFPEANYRHYCFMLEGLKEVSAALQKLGVKFVVNCVASPSQGMLELSGNASIIIVDRGYLRINREWYTYAIEKAQVPLIQVEDNIIIPVEVASQKEEYSAATLRPKLLDKLNYFLELPQKLSPNKHSLDMDFVNSVPIANIEKLAGELEIDNSINKSSRFLGGTTEAKKQLEQFIEHSLKIYEKEGNTPDNTCASDLSPYLHFGQISPLFVARQILESYNSIGHKFLEEMIIRRELAINFVHYSPYYDSFLGLPEWSKKTLTEHAEDQRSYIYSLSELETSQTHDVYWNAAQKEMVLTGKMNGYMRMYWGKKIIEWTKNPEEAYRIALFLNNKYEIDGRDPNSYAGVAWCFGKHDRPWREREIFGKVRFMNNKGLEKKFNMDTYLLRVNSLVDNPHKGYFQ